MIRFTLDGRVIQTDDGACLKDILPDHNQALSLAIIRPGVISEEATRHFRITTTKGEFVAGIPDSSVTLPDMDNASFNTGLHWSDRYAAAFGPFHPISPLPDVLPGMHEVIS